MSSGGSIDEGTGGVTEGMKRRVVLPMAGTLAETDHVLGHELVHAFQYDIAAQRASAERRRAGVESLPLWFIEGMAEYLSLGPVDAHTAMWLRDAARKEKLPHDQRSRQPEYFPYRWGQALWAFIGGRWGDERIAQIYRDALRSERSGSRARRTPRASTPKSSRPNGTTAIHDAVRSDPQGDTPASARSAGSLTALGQGRAGDERVAVVSPDGTKIIYFSSRDMLSIGLFLADASTGRIIRKLVDTSLDPHFTSLQFINSAGSWSPTAASSSWAACATGRPCWRSSNVADGDVVREIPFPQAGRDPEPHLVARRTFGRILGHRRRRHRPVHLQPRRRTTERRLTSDAVRRHSARMVARTATRIAFVTDRFTTQLENR